MRGWMAIILAGAGLVMAPAHAQVIPAPNPLLLDGKLAQCGAFPIFLAPTLDDVGYAIVDIYGPRILLNPNRMTPLSTALKLFIFAHECGHLVTGGTEDDADCWAIQIGKQQGWFTLANWPALIDSLGNSPGDFSHRPGPQRLARIAACFAAG